MHTTTGNLATMSRTMQIGIVLIRHLADKGFESYIVGGAVRDHVLNRQSTDVDITTIATPDELRDLFPDMESVGAHFGVNLIKFQGLRFEVATFRTDGAYSDQRHPDFVAFTKDVHEDLKRRDFTMNALIMDHELRIFDFHDGLRDLAMNTIRMIGSAKVRFHEDPLRILRAVRFQTTLGFTLGLDLYMDMRDNAHMLNRLSKERVAGEMNRILTSGKAGLGVRTMMASGIMRQIIPEFVALLGCSQNPKHHPEGDVYEHTLGLLDRLEAGCSLTLALAVLLHDIGKPGTAGVKDGQPTFYAHEVLGATMARTILNRLRYSNEIISTVCGHVADHMRFRVVEEMRRSKLLRFIGQENFDELLQLHELDAKAGSGKLHHAEFIKKVLAETPDEVIHPIKIIDGSTLIGMGLKPGPLFRILLEYTSVLQLEGILTTFDEAIQLISDFIAWDPGAQAMCLDALGIKHNLVSAAEPVAA